MNAFLCIVCTQNLDTVLKSARPCFNLRTAVLSGYTCRTAGRVCGGKMNRGLDKKWVPDITRWFKWLKFITYSRYHLDVKIEFNLQPVSGNLYQEKSCQEVGTLAVWVVLTNKRVKRLGYWHRHHPIPMANAQELETNLPFSSLG